MPEPIDEPEGMIDAEIQLHGFFHAGAIATAAADECIRLINQAKARYFNPIALEAKPSANPGRKKVKTAKPILLRKGKKRGKSKRTLSQPRR